MAGGPRRIRAGCLNKRRRPACRQCGGGAATEDCRLPPLGPPDLHACANRQCISPRLTRNSPTRAAASAQNSSPAGSPHCPSRDAHCRTRFEQSAKPPHAPLERGAFHIGGQRRGHGTAAGSRSRSSTSERSSFRLGADAVWSECPTITGSRTGTKISAHEKNRNQESNHRCHRRHLRHPTRRRRTVRHPRAWP